MIKVVVLACVLSIAHCGVVPAIPQQYLQQAPSGPAAYQTAAAPQLPPHLAAQARALPPPVFRSAAPQQAYQVAPQQAYQVAPQHQAYQVAPQHAYQVAAPQPQQYAQAAPPSGPAYQAAPAPQVQYRPQPAAPRAPAPQPQRRLPANVQALENPEDYDPNPSYNFGFDVKDDQFTNYQNRKEQREGDKISGSYSVVDSDGFIRTVTYTADPVGGFKAEVVREPTDIKVLIPTPPPATASAPQYRAAAPQYAAQPAPQYARAPAPAAPQYAPAPQAYPSAPAAVKATYPQAVPQYQG